jgi:hypothetical protein
MSALQDREMERLSDLLAQGKLSNAREIASLLKVELGEQADPIPENCAVVLRTAWSDH